MVAVVWLISIVDECHLALAEQRVTVAAHGLDGNGTIAHRLGDTWKVVLGKGEEHGNRVHLRDDHQARGVGGVDDVPNVDEANPRDAVDGRDDSRVFDVQSRRVDCGGIGHGDGLGHFESRARVIYILLARKVVPL